MPAQRHTGHATKIAERRALGGKVTVMLERRVRLDDSGAITIPMDHRRVLGILPCDTLILTLDEGEIRLLTPRRAIQRAQELVRRYTGLAQMQLTHNASGDEERNEIDNACSTR